MNARVFCTFVIFTFMPQQLFGVEYPEGYRSWDHVKTMLIDENHPLFDPFGGIHHIYGNEPALKAMKSESEYPDGTVFVFDLLIAVPVEGGIAEGERRRLDVMVKDEKKFSLTGGWGYGSFKGSAKELVVQDVATKCYGCHLSKKDADFIFSVYRK